MSIFSSLYSSSIPRHSRAAGQKVQCFHCGLAVQGPPRLWVEFDGEQKPVCCIGCQALYDVLISHGLIDYYRERERRAAGH